MHHKALSEAEKKEEEEKEDEINQMMELSDRNARLCIHKRTVIYV